MRNKLKPEKLPDVPEITFDNMPNMPRLLDEKQAAQFLGVSCSFLRKARTEGAPGNRTPGPLHVKVGGRRLYRVSDLCVWVDGLKGQEVI